MATSTMVTTLALIKALLQYIDVNNSERDRWIKFDAMTTRKVCKTGEMRAMDLAIEAIKFIINMDHKTVLRIADLGCGDGSIIKHFYSKSELEQYNKENRIMTKYENCSIQIDSFDLYRKKEHYIFNVDFSDLKNGFGIEDSYYDIIICCLSLQSKNEKKLMEIERICKNGGYLLIWQPQSLTDDILEIIRTKTSFCIEDVQHLQRFTQSNKCKLQQCRSGYTQIFCKLNY